MSSTCYTCALTLLNLKHVFPSLSTLASLQPGEVGAGGYDLIDMMLRLVRRGGGGLIELRKGVGGTFGRQTLFNTTTNKSKLREGGS